MVAEFIALVAAKLASPLASFLIIITVARVWGTTVLGQYTTIWVWLTLFQHFSLFGICEYISREIGANKAEAGRFLMDGLALSLLFSMVCGALMVSGAFVFGYPEKIKAGIVVASAALPFAACTLVCQAAFTALRKINYVTVASVLESLLFLITGIMVVFGGHMLIALIACLVFVRISAAVLNLSIARRLPAVRFRFEWGGLRRHVLPVIVFGLTGVAFQVFMRIDVIMLSKMTSMSTVGLYSAASKLVEICMMLSLTFYFLSLPIAAEAYNKFRKSMRERMRRHSEPFIMIVFGVFGCCMLFAGPIIRFFYGGAFTAAVVPFRILMAAFLIHSAEITMEITCQAAGYQRAALRVAIVRALANILLNLALIPLWGAVGSAAATLLSVAVSFTLFQLFVKKTFGGSQLSRLLGKPALICLLTAGFVYPLTGRLNALFLMPLFFSGYWLMTFGFKKYASAWPGALV